MTTVVNFVCDRLPDPDGCRFIELENDRGESVGHDVGVWHRRDDGLVELRVALSQPPIIQALHDNAELIALQATVAQQAQMIEHLRGGPTPLYTAADMANAARDGFRDGVESRRSIMLALTEEIRLDDALIAERERLLNLFECPDHGQCVPYAMEQVAALRKDLESHKRMLLAAACEIGAIGKALKADMNADGDELLGTVIDLKAQNTRMLEWLKDISRTSGDKGAVMGARQLLKEFSE